MYHNIPLLNFSPVLLSYFALRRCFLRHFLSPPLLVRNAKVKSFKKYYYSIIQLQFLIMLFVPIFLGVYLVRVPAELLLGPHLEQRGVVRHRHSPLTAVPEAAHGAVAHAQ